jgi:hypothetical protein
VAAGPFVVGRSYVGRNGYIEYLPGDLPIVISVPHGGALAPKALRDRTCGNNDTDWHTEELARAIRTALHDRTGKYPHVVINRLARTKLDPNRDSTEATCGDGAALASWREWHALITVARHAVADRHGSGLYVDLHGHGHPAPRLELGYLVPPDELRLADAALDARAADEPGSSIRTLSARSPLTFSALLRGPSSLGSLYEANGYPAVPSAAHPDPGGQAYFWGEEAYDLRRHGCTDGGSVCGVQVETNYDSVRATPEQRAGFAAATARVLDLYLAAHYGLRITPGSRAAAVGGGAWR